MLEQATLALFKDKAGNEFYIAGVGWCEPTNNEEVKAMSELNASVFCRLMDLQIVGWDTFKMQDGEIMVGAVFQLDVDVERYPTLSPINLWLKAGPVFEHYLHHRRKTPKKEIH